MLRLCLPPTLFLLISFQVLAGAATDTPETSEVDNSPLPASGILNNGGNIEGAFALTIADQQVAATYLPQTLGDYRGAVILLHDKATQLDGPLIGHLREDLTRFGWDTLTVSLQHQTPAEIEIDNPAIPVNPETEQPTAETADAATENAPAEIADDTAANSDNANAETNPNEPVDQLAASNPARMDAALAWLQAKNPPRLIFIGHGAGIETAVNAIAATPQTVNALVMLSADSNVTAQTVIDANLPILDLLGSKVDAEIKQAAILRRSELKFGATQPYSQRQIYGADRDFQGMESIISKQVHSWLHRQLIGDMRR